MQKCFNGSWFLGKKRKWKFNRLINHKPMTWWHFCYRESSHNVILAPVRFLKVRIMLQYHFFQGITLCHFGSAALLTQSQSVSTFKVRFLDLVFLWSAGGPENLCYGVQACNCKFRTLKVQILKVLTLWYCIKLKQC